MRTNKEVARRKSGIQLESVAAVYGVVDLELRAIISVLSLDGCDHCSGPALAIHYLETTIVFFGV